MLSFVNSYSSSIRSFVLKTSISFESFVGQGLHDLHTEKHIPSGVMPSFLRLATAALAAAFAVPFAAAQTYSDCDPLNSKPLRWSLLELVEQDADQCIETCPADPGLANYTFYTDFTAGDSAFDHWNTTAGTVNSTSQGAAFIISEEGDSPTIQTAFYFFFGHVDVKMKIANGTGIISSIVFLSDDLDEIDWVCYPPFLLSASGFITFLDLSPVNGRRIN